MDWPNRRLCKELYGQHAIHYVYSYPKSSPRRSLDSDKSVLLTNITYSTALAIRTAQNYGLSVKGAAVTCQSDGPFQCAYGVAFSSSPTPGDFDRTKFILFADVNAVLLN